MVTSPRPCRAGLVDQPEDYPWSSAAAHLKGVTDAFQVLDTTFFERAGGVDAWRERADMPIPAGDLKALRRWTFGNRRYGDDAFVTAPGGDALWPSMAPQEAGKTAESELYSP